MDILIKNMEFPKKMECLEILLFHDGYTSYRVHERDEWTSTKAIELKPHGDLMEKSIPDYDDFQKNYQKYFSDNVSLNSAHTIIADIIGNSPTILEASDG